MNLNYVSMVLVLNLNYVTIVNLSIIGFAPASLSSYIVISFKSPITINGRVMLK